MKVQRVAVVDDHQVFSDLVSVALASEPGFECVGTAATVSAGRDLVAATRPDIALIDVRLPDGDGLDLAEGLMGVVPNLRVIMLTGYPRAEMLPRSRRAKVSGLLAKELPLRELLAAMEGATAEDPFFVELDVVEHNLTPRELQVLNLLGEGREARAIARELGISHHTARDHVKNVLLKLDARSQLDAVVTAARSGILRLGA